MQGWIQTQESKHQSPRSRGEPHAGPLDDSEPQRGLRMKASIIFLLFLFFSRGWRKSGRSQSTLMQFEISPRSRARSSPSLLPTWHRYESLDEEGRKYNTTPDLNGSLGFCSSQPCPSEASQPETCPREIIGMRMRVMLTESDVSRTSAVGRRP